MFPKHPSKATTAMFTIKTVAENLYQTVSKSIMIVNQIYIYKIRFMASPALL